jgi:outer membrane biosynthesis protein TonB
MDRLQKKCFVASAGFHLLLALILLVGPAFLTSPSPAENEAILDIIPSKLIDAPFSGGGSPNVKPPPPAPLIPPTPTSTPTPQTLPKPEVVKPEQPKETSREQHIDQPDPDSLEPTEHKKPRPITLTPTVKRPDAQAKAKEMAAAEARERQAADQKRRAAAEALGSAVRSLRDDLSGITAIGDPGSGGGEAYASYDQVVRSIYWHAWVPPEETASDNAIAKATVTISSDGTVVSARLVTPSADSSVNSSIQRTLERVTFIRPFPEGAKEKQRVYHLKFDLRAKRLNG